MGHRRKSQPRRGSIGYLPRGRAKSMEARIRAWPEISSEEPKLLAHAGFKAGCVQIVSIDDREKTPNAGKQLVSLGTVLVTPPILVVGVRGYSKDPLLLVFGSPSKGIHEILGSRIKQTQNAKVLNFFPVQATETVRLEEAILGTLTVLNTEQNVYN